MLRLQHGLHGHDSRDNWYGEIDSEVFFLNYTACALTLPGLRFRTFFKGILPRTSFLSSITSLGRNSTSENAENGEKSMACLYIVLPERRMGVVCVRTEDNYSMYIIK